MNPHTGTVNYLALDKYSISNSTNAANALTLPVQVWYNHYTTDLYRDKYWYSVDWSRD